MEEAKKWFSKAVEDFNTAKYNLKGEKIDAGLFFLQQSAEKALKAVYIKRFKDLIKVHDLVILARKINAPDNIIDLCKQLNPAYQYTRYPDAIVKIDDPYTKAKDFVNYVEEILKWTKKNL